jgi:2-iminobutanoate/2-iminopropanoate deaminase
MTSVVEVFGHIDDPMPVGVRVGDVLHLSGVTGLGGDDVDAQLTRAFDTLRGAVERAGASIDNIAQVSFFLRNRQDIPAINPPWVDVFPDERDRPTYKFMVAELPAGQLVQLEAFAVCGARRTVLHLPGVAHINPIPMGVRIGTMLFSSRVLPYDPATGKPPEGVDRQAECLFGNVRRLLDEGGMQGRHITQGRLFVADRGYVSVAQPHWRDLVAGASAPSLHVTPYSLAPALLVMLEIIADSQGV